MAWLNVTVSAEDVAQGRGAHIQEKFRAALGRLRMAKDVAMFGAEAAGGAAIFYFSPGCEPLLGDFLRAMGAVDCPPPLKGDVALLAGPETARDELLQA